MPLRNDLLNPISPDKPSGENLYYAPVYDKIKEARRQDDDAPQGLWQHERKVADWPQVIKLASEALATKTKDLQLAAWLAEAMLKREGIAGLRESLAMIQGLVENFWDTLYPELEDGDAEFRSAPLVWVGERWEIPVKQTPLTKSGYDWFRYKESRTVGTEEQANESNEKIVARAAAIAEGKITQEEFDKAFEESPKAYYVNLLATYDAALEAVSSLGDACDAKFGNVAPSFRILSSALEEMRQTVYILLQKKREKEPDEPIDAPPPDPEPIEEPVSIVGVSGAAAAPARAPIRKAGALTAEPVDRDDAVARVIACAKYLRQQDPYNPAPYMLLRGMRWGELRASGDSIDALLLSPPPSEVRQALKKAALEGNWTEVLETAETAAGMECGRGWLDLQRYAARACYELGSYYYAVRAAIVSGLRAILKDYPQLVDYTLMDDTPVANAETLAWLKEEVVPPTPEPEPVAAAPEPSYMPPPAYDQPAGEAAAEAPPDAFELAIQAARRGNPQEGIEILMREMAQARSGRARFQRKSQLAQLCVSAGRQEIASPILTDLASEIERRKLEDWESPDMIAHPLAMLYQCMSREAAPEERQKLYSWICRLDPLQAMNVSR